MCSGGYEQPTQMGSGQEKIQDKSSPHSWALHSRKYRINKVRGVLPDYGATSTGPIEEVPYVYPISAYNSHTDLGAEH